MNEIWQEAKSVHLPVINSNERELRDRQLQLRNLKNFRKLPPDSHCEIIRTVGAKIVHIAYNLDYCENKAQTLHLTQKCIVKMSQELSTVILRTKYYLKRDVADS